MSTVVSGNHVVAIGASAGGLEAINEFFDNMPQSSGFSFVIIQHLSPDYKSLMSELLAKHTQMEIIEARENIQLQPNKVYLLPARKLMRLKENRLQLKEQVRDHTPNMAIDVFFESLATERGDKAVGIILSGTGTDGTRGIRAIKDHGGTVVVQDPATAQFDGMPNSAVNSGVADIVSAPNLMPEELVDFLKAAPFLRSINSMSGHEEAILQDILAKVFEETGHDFFNYKLTTIKRRLAKRMAELGIQSIADYLSHISSRPAEVKQLCKEFLLHVTRFFRDQESFISLHSKVITELVTRRKDGDTIKVWDVACSTGEEAYSLAMLFDEELKRQQKEDLEVKIFASDISQQVIEHASKGLYSNEEVKEISEERLKKYFVKEAGGYRVVPSLRKVIVFARHDVAKDPPFHKIDLIVCRNMLIYMTPVLQKAILGKFHFAINDDGFLFLGPSENINTLKDVMTEVDRKWKIYKCINKARIGEIELTNPGDKVLFPSYHASSKAKNAYSHLTDIFKETLLAEYQIAGILIDREFEVKHAIGNFKKFIDFPEGNFNFNLLKLVSSDLAVALSTGIRKATKDNQPYIQRNMKVQSGDSERRITMIVKPYLEQKVYVQPFIFIVLKEEPVVEMTHNASLPSLDASAVSVINALEQELHDTKENLQALVEEVESANEELQSSNEEIVSANEELQSTNEELQSLNEELHTVNTEHQLKIKELIELNDDLNNYFKNSDVGQIIVDRNFIIRKFTPIATKQVNLISSDVGRSISDISTNIKGLDLIADIRDVLLTSQSREKELTMDDNKFFLMRIVPYQRQDKSMDGVVINFIDITALKQASLEVESAYQELKATSEKLEETNAKLEQSNLDLLQFASVASHDLKEPLRKIQAFGNLLKEKAESKLNGVEQNYLEKMINCANRMQSLIDDLLTLSRLSNNETPHLDVDLGNVVKQILEDLEISIGDKKATIEVQELPVVKGISGQMHQLFQNLISNAIKFNEGQPVISIWHEPMNEQLQKEFELHEMNGYHAIHIQDNGIGFDQRYSEKIFKVFQRLEKTNYTGTGIGLAIVKKIIDNHDGHVRAFSKPGKGARFTILLKHGVGSE